VSRNIIKYLNVIEISIIDFSLIKYEDVDQFDPTKWSHFICDFVVNLNYL
jgi:hypothetical protein